MCVGLEFDEIERPPAAVGVAWFCVRTHHRHEHVAACQLHQEASLEVFLPRIRYKRAGRRGPVWTTEALFQNYLFVRFNFETHLRRVRHARAVQSVVHFGDRWPVIPDPVIESLREALGRQELQVVPDDLEVGERVQVAGGPLGGLEGVVSRVMPGPQRVAVLLDFLGRQMSVELAGAQLVRHDVQAQRTALVCG